MLRTTPRGRGAASWPRAAGWRSAPRIVRRVRLGGLRYARAVQVFLIRHADAVDETLELRAPHRHLSEAGGAKAGPRDEAVELRAPPPHLSGAGRAQARALGDRLRWHDCLPTQIWSSPLVRAIQTAELVANHLQSELMVEAVAALAPDENPRALVA